MNKLVLTMALFSVFGVAHADSNNWKVIDVSDELRLTYKDKETKEVKGFGEVVNQGKNGFDVFVSSVGSKTGQGDSGNGYGFGASYTSYQNEHVFLQPSVQFVNMGNQYNDKMYLANFDVAYTHYFNNGMTISPKAGLGFFKAVYDDGSNYGGSYNFGVEVGLNKSLSVDVSRTHAFGQNSGSYVDLTSVSLKYKF